MGSMSYIGVIERYHDHRDAIRELLKSIVSGIADIRLLEDEQLRQEVMEQLAEHYPFVDLMFVLDGQAIQVSDNIPNPGRPSSHREHNSGRGKDRTRRPYVAGDWQDATVRVTDHYLSSASRNLCVSAALRWTDDDGSILGYLVLDIDLARTVEFLMGDTARRRFQPLFRLFYGLISTGLFMVVLLLLYAASRELFGLVLEEGSQRQWHLKPFGAIIFLTLALAVFDLSKTILEEEVLMHKDIFRHSSTRRTITRFIAAILIAVSIEALLLMFKAAVGNGESILPAAGMMLTAVGLLVGLGVYVYLGARAEVLLKSLRA